MGAVQPTPEPSGLSPTGKVILGMIASGKRTGYDIKRLVDKTTRHFWAASYGQIYPELKRLEADGLISGRAEPSGGRHRRVFELTDAGREALHDWLRSDDSDPSELRDEGMLKLFFSDALPERRVPNIRAMRAREQRKLEQLLALQEHAAGGAPGMYTTLQLGIGATRWMIEWCDAAIRDLSSHDTTQE